MGEKTTMSVLEGNNFVVSDLRGDIDASPTEPLGLFAWDTRFLSRWLLTVDGQRPNVLSTDDLDYFYVQFFLVPGTGTIYVDADLSVIRKRAVGNGFHEDVTIFNHKDKQVDLKVRIEAAADFADLFEVKDHLTKKGEFYHRVESDRLVLGYRRDQFVRETLITSSIEADIDEHGLSFAVHIEPHSEWTTRLDVAIGLGGIGEHIEEAKYVRGGQRTRSQMKRSLEKLGEAVPRLSCEWPSLQVTYSRSLVDLAALRFYPLTLAGQARRARGLALKARAALTWIDTYGDRNGDGYVEYSRRNTETGLENQCWKDSWNSILFADGTLSRLPRATCEIQGYVYDAKMRCARLARKFWNDPELASRLESQAAELKRRFNQDFWLPERGFFALAIDGDGRKVDALTSNIGHLLWSGIVDEDKAEAVVRHLMGSKLYSGWGVRTMAEGEGGYNPIGYHVGTVWPHDNSFIAMGLRRYGYREEAARVAMHMLEAATSFKGRLPEAFAGYPRQLTEFPVEYPTACSPQAWASGTPLLLIRAILGLEPIGNNLLVDPAIPIELGQLELLDIPGRWGRIDAFGRGRVDTMSEKTM